MSKVTHRQRVVVYGVMAVALAMFVVTVVLSRRHTPSGTEILARVGVSEGDLAAEERDTADVIQRVADGVASRPRSAETWGRLGGVLQVHGLEKPALAAYSSARRLDREDFRWHYFPGLILAGTGDARAVSMFESAVACKGDYAPARVRLGDAFLEAERGDAAESAYRSALDIDPANTHARIGLERVDAVGAGNTQADQAALALSTRTPREDPALHEVLRYGVSAYWRMMKGNDALDAGRYDVAETHYLAARDAYPEEAIYHLALGNLYEKQERRSEAIEAYVEAIRLEPDRRNVHHRLARLYDAVGRPDKAIESYESVVSGGKADALVYAQYTSLLMQLQRERDAVAVLRRGLVRHQDDPNVRTQLAWILATSPDPEIRDGAAALSLVEPVTRDEQNANVLTLAPLAAAYAESERFEEARETLDRAIASTRGTAAKRTDADVLEQMKTLFAQGQPYHRP